MADSITEDTSVSEDTSTNEELQDTEVIDDLESDDTSFEDVDDDDTEEAEDLGESELEDTEPAEDEEEPKEDEKASEEPDAPDEETKEEDTPSEDTKKHNQEMAAKRVAERQAREQAKEAQQQNYLEKAEDDKDLALRQLQVDAYNNRVEKNQGKLDSGIERAVASIDLFREGTPEVKEELARRLEDFEQKYVRYDTNGDPIEVKADVYEYLTNEADSIRRVLRSGARTQTKAKDKAKARTDTLPSRAPKEPVVDPDLAAFDEEVAKWE